MVNVYVLPPFEIFGRAVATSGISRRPAEEGLSGRASRLAHVGWRISKSPGDEESAQSTVSKFSAGMPTRNVPPSLKDSAVAPEMQTTDDATMIKVATIVTARTSKDCPARGERRQERRYEIATIRSIAPRARSAISGGTVTTCFQSRSESRSFSSVIIFM